MKLQKRKEELAYIAGLIDGEGTIRVSNRGSVGLRISNNNLEVLQWVNEQTGNRKNKIYSDKRPVRVKTCYSLQWSGRKALFILREVLPYLRIKKERAELVLAFWVIKGGGETLSIGEKNTRQQLYMRMKKLNKGRMV